MKPPIKPNEPSKVEVDFKQAIADFWLWFLLGGLLCLMVGCVTILG